MPLTETSDGQLLAGRAKAHYQAGYILHRKRELAAALHEYRLALEVNPGLAAAHYNAAKALQGLGRDDDALAEYRGIAVSDPLFDVGRLDAGRLLLGLGRHDESIRAIEQSLASRPQCAEAYCALGAVFHARGETDAALRHYRRALALDPELRDARLNIGYIELLSGDFARGWRDCEARWGSSQLAKREVPRPQWMGEPLQGRTIAIHAEQGLGDSIQFLRYVPIVAAAGGRVVLIAPKRLMRLAAEVPGIAALRTFGEAVPDFDWHCPLLSLPLAFGTTLETIPAAVPYLSVPEQAKVAGEEICWARERLRVGLCWAGAPLLLRDRFRCRSIPFSLLKPLFGIGRVAWYSLQMGEAAAEVDRSGCAITDLSPYVGDMADTAAQIGHLDLVITVDTSVAHLAGALGVATVVMLPFTHDWRWLREREDSPWYPTMRLIRQATPGDWGPVIERARRVLIERVADFESGEPRNASSARFATDRVPIRGT